MRDKEFALIAIVAIVAIVAVFALFSNSGQNGVITGPSEQENIAGLAGGQGQEIDAEIRIKTTQYVYQIGEEIELS